MNLSEFEVAHNNLVSGLIEKMPEIKTTLNTLFEIKRQRKLKGLTMNPKESEQEMKDWEETTDRQGIGNSIL